MWKRFVHVEFCNHFYPAFLCFKILLKSLEIICFWKSNNMNKENGSGAQVKIYSVYKRNIQCMNIISVKRFGF